MRTHLHFDSVPDEATLRVILRTAAAYRATFPSYNHMTMRGAEPWQPVVNTEGTGYGVSIPAAPPATVAAILAAVEEHVTSTAERSEITT